jgi:hypothetical protein
MAHLATLKIVNKPTLNPHTAEERKRHKLIVKLQEQLAMIECELKGTVYARHKWVIVADYDGEPNRVQRPVRLKQWWFKDAAGVVLFAVRYGTKHIELAKGMSAIEVGTIDKLPTVIRTVISAVAAGELDAKLVAIINERQFLPRAKTVKAVNKRTAA